MSAISDHSWQDECRKTLALAIPSILVQLGNLTMGIVDTIIVGRVDSQQLAGVAAGNSLFWSVVMASIGLQMGLDTIMSQAMGAKDQIRADACLGQGLILSLFASLIVAPLIYVAAMYYAYSGADAAVVVATQPYLKVLCWSLPSVMLFNALLKYWQSMGTILPASCIMIVANGLNYLAASAFVNGLWGFPKLGAEGVGYATFVSRLFTLVALFAVSFYLWEKRNRSSLSEPFHARVLWRYEPQLMRNILRLGLPALGQVSLEVGAFALATTLVTHLGVIPLATHQIVLTMASFTFMFPLGLSSATSIRVGYLVGAKKVAAAIRAGWIGIALGASIMGTFALCLALFPKTLVGWFTRDAAVVLASLSIIGWATLFQVFDGVQVVGAGALRGLGDTKLSFLANLIGHYAIGISLGLTFCFYFAWGLPGIWLGLTFGLMGTAVLIVAAFWRKSRSLNRL